MKHFFAMGALLAAGAAEAACPELLGRYEGIYDDSYRSEYSEIAIEAAPGGVSIFYRQGAGYEGYRARYVTDGLSHEGDGKVTGQEYTAICEGSFLRVEAKFQELRTPVVFSFAREGETLRLVESLGEYRRETGRLRLKSRY